MENKKRYIIITLIFLSLILLFNKNFFEIRYSIDTLISFIITNKNKSIIYEKANTKDYKKYIKIYQRLPKNFSHIGFFLLYTAEKNIYLSDIANQIIEFTHYYRKSPLIRKIKKLNSFTHDYLKKNRSILIPGGLNAQIIDPKNFKKPEIIKVKGLYITATSAGSSSILEKMKHYRKSGINSIVFDIKDVTGLLSYKSKTSIAKKYNLYDKSRIDNLPLLIRELKKNKIYSIARVSVFQDRHLYKRAPELAIKSRNTGRPWRTGRELWLDPTNKIVQNYNISLAIELADMGIDEIQFDYIRFPTSGKQGDALFVNHFGKMKRENTIALFLSKAYKEISKRNTLLSIDIFGVVAWGKNVDIRSTGQRIELLAKHCDIISPMLYPSHFNNEFDGIARPGDAPYYFIHKGCQKVLELAGKHEIIVRPWLQAFKWRVSNYNAHYILEQIRGSNNSGAKGYLFWNASNDYRVVYEAMRLIPPLPKP
jgi:hypothetical protein